MLAMLGGALNRRELADALADRACARKLAVRGFRDELTFDVDSGAIEAHGRQVAGAYDGHSRTTCFHPLVAYTDTGDMLGVRLRPGDVHTADDIGRFLTPPVAPAPNPILPGDNRLVPTVDRGATPRGACASGSCAPLPPSHGTRGR